MKSSGRRMGTMSQRVLEPTTLTIITTNKCTAECAHCCMNSSPERTETLTWEQLESTLLQAFKELTLRVIIFAGGEPMLLGETLYKAIRLCKQNRVGTRIVTNAYWGANREHARKKLQELKDAGLDELNISMDDYHDPYIRQEAVKNAYEIALTMDFHAVVLANCYGPHSTTTPESIEKMFATPNMRRRFDETGRGHELDQQCGNTLVILSNSPIQRLARARTHVKEADFPPALADAEMDKIAESIGGCPWALKSASISAGGHFVACCGFEVENNPVLDYGDLKDHSLKELLDKADNDLVTNLIAILGPVKLVRLLKQICPDEIEFPERHGSYCEACEDLVGSKKNRAALYKHMDKLADLVLEARDIVRRQYLARGIREWPMLKIKTHMPGDAPAKATEIAEATGRMSDIARCGN